MCSCGAVCCTRLLSHSGCPEHLHCDRGEQLLIVFSTHFHNVSPGPDNRELCGRKHRLLWKSFHCSSSWSSIRRGKSGLLGISRVVDWRWTLGRLGRVHSQSYNPREHSLSNQNSCNHKFTHPEISVTSKGLSWVKYIIHFTL